MSSARKPSHPGVFFKHTVLDERKIPITSAAKSLGVTRKALSEFVNGKTMCSRSMARRLSEATGTSVSVWITMQAKLDIWKSENMVLEAEITPVRQFGGRFEHRL